MLLLTFAQINGLEKKQPITALKGTIIAVYPTETKQSTQNPGKTYFQQSIVIREVGGQLTLRVTLRDKDPIQDSDKGKVVYISQGKNSKGQYGGVQADHWTGTSGQNAGKMMYAVLVGYQAEVGFTEPGTTPAPAASAGQAPSQQRQAAAPRAAGGNPKLDLVRLAIAMDMCVGAASLVVEQRKAKLGEITGEAPVVRDVLALATSLFIEGNKSGLFDGVGTSWKAYTTGAPAQAAPPPPPPPPAPEPPPQDPPDTGFDNGLGGDDGSSDVPF